MKKLTFSTTSPVRYVTFLSEKTKAGFIVDRAWVSRNNWFLPVYNLVMTEKPTPPGRLEFVVGPVAKER